MPSHRHQGYEGGAREALIDRVGDCVGSAGADGPAFAVPPDHPNNRTCVIDEGPQASVGQMMQTLKARDGIQTPKDIVNKYPGNFVSVGDPIAQKCVK